ncbi:hypothetical protein IQ231_14880 [Cuspidothrix issatschenkoi LEGE 03284]|uniref:hypothetical protein n=1 Tax=Cuspidothrix issatschenkoi TaxID=230752 RepID=UPI001882A23E|nr:hypothetical protein [Cuspidothrix issatschenkoi]MBE9232927.1 hypothetical protein [Cuspidothrix issatschenkoi LEGE 03284]
MQFYGTNNIDVITLGANTQFRFSGGITGNNGFGTGSLLVTLSGVSGLTSDDISDAPFLLCNS